MNQKDLEQIGRRRLAFLDKVFEASGGDRSAIVNMWAVGNLLGFDRAETSKIADYLRGEGLIETVALGGGLSITHDGIKEVEAAIRNPDRPTEHFPPMNVTIVGTMVNSQIQQGTQDSTQTGSFSAGDLNAIGQWAAEVEKAAPTITELDAATRAELQADAQALALKCHSATTNHAAIREMAKSVKNILEGATGSLIASGLITHVATFARFFG